VDAGNFPAIQHDSAAGHSFETANGTKERTFPASRRSNKDNEFLLLDPQVDILQSVKGIVVFLDLN
jgi:hypothetical protein